MAVLTPGPPDGSSIIDPAAICAATCFGGCGINPGLAATAIGDHLVTILAAHLATAMQDLRLAAATAALIPCWQWQAMLSLALLAVELLVSLALLTTGCRAARLAGAGSHGRAARLAGADHRL